jgi:hypothetical protein
MKLRTIKIVNPVARTMLQDRRSPKVVPPKKGKGAKYNRGKEKRNVLRD